MKIKDVMTKTSLRLYESDSLQFIFDNFYDSAFNGGVVYNHNEELVGVFTKEDLLLGLQLKKQQLKEIMSTNYKILQEEALVSEIEFGNGLCNPVQQQHNEITGYITKEQFSAAYAKDARIKLKHFDAIFNSAHNGILSIDAYGNITMINPAAEKMAKISKEEAIGKFLTDVVLPSGLLNVVRTGKGHTEKYKAGKRTYITNRSPIIEDGEVVGAVGVFQDVSEIEFISQELNAFKQLAEELDTVIETSTDGICIIKNKQISKMNSRFKEMFNIDKKTDISLPAEINNVIDQVIEHRESVSHLHRNPATNNSLIISGTPIYSDKRLNEVVINVKDITEIENLQEELAKTKKVLDTLNMGKQYNFIYQSDRMKRLMKLISQVANFDVTVLITGESGAGKGEVANLIHQLSHRKDRPYIQVNCGAIPETLIESELFGYEPGAFTGASKKGKKGYFEQADGGTLFLDEIGELPLDTQVKLLTVLQDKKIVKIGAEKSQEVDIRIIAATNKNLEELVAKGEFREDLYYRLNVMPIHMPPLRERKADIPLLVKHYEAYFSKKYNKQLYFTEEAFEAFHEYNWPGNVRELVNVIERIYVTSLSSTIEKEDVHDVLHLSELNKKTVKKANVQVNNIIPLKEAVEELEKELIHKALKNCDSYRKVAKLLGVNVSTISRKIKKYEEDIGNDAKV